MIDLNMKHQVRGWGNMQVRTWPPAKGRAAILAGILAVAIPMALAILLAGCQPRENFPANPALLLTPEREALQYKTLILPNRLKVMLVSNPNANRSAASLAVGVGSLDDPGNRPGLVHFLEHMLFLGTKKYPEVGGYSKYMSSHAGFSNAYTADDHTNYFFSVSHEGFEEGLDRFSQFFIAPLMSEEFTGKEINAVNQEHSKNLENDYWRIRQVQRNLYSKSHPINRFSTGNAETLKGVGREELLAFYRGNYSSDRMALAVVGNRSLEALESMVRGRFGKIPDRDQGRTRYPGEYLPRKQALRVLRVEPIKDQRALSLHFPLPPLREFYRAKPLRLLSAILGHEGKGSLLSLLKAENLATSLSAGGGENTADYASLDINIGLTPLGLERYRDVLLHVMRALSGLRSKGIPRYLFDEYRTLSELEHRFQEVPASASEARRMAAMMLSYPLHALPDEPFLLRDYDPQLYGRILEHLRPDNLLVTLIAKGVSTDQVEKYYGARFGYEEDPGEILVRLSSASADSRWHLPQPNPFIPRNVALRAPSGPLKMGGISIHHMRMDGVPEAVLGRLRPMEGQTFLSGEAFVQRAEGLIADEDRRRWLPLMLKDAVSFPVRLLDTPRAKVWFAPDWRLRQPKAQIVLKFYLENDQASPRNVALGLLYEASLDEGLNELGYPLKEAGMGYSIAKVKGGITLSLGGYSARLLELLDFFAMRLRTVEIGEEVFASIKERMIRGFENQRLGQPYQQSRYFTRMILATPNFTREAKLAAVRGLTLNDVKAYAKGLLHKTYVEGVVVGNLARSPTRAAIINILDNLGARVLPEKQRVRETILGLPSQADWVFSDRLEVNNSLVNMIYQVGLTNPTLRGALLMISRPLGQQFYFHMRTKQQLGYIVGAGMGQMRKMLHMTLLVQSGQYPADELIRRMEAFLPGFIRYFKALTPEQFETFRSAVIKAKLERDKSLGDIANRLFWMAFRNDERFDYVSRDIAAVEALQRGEVEAVLKRYLSGEGRKRLVIRLLGKTHAGGVPKGQNVKLPASVLPKAG